MQCLARQHTQGDGVRAAFGAVAVHLYYPLGLAQLLVVVQGNGLVVQQYDHLVLTAAVRDNRQLPAGPVDRRQRRGFTARCRRKVWLIAYISKMP